MCGLVWDSSPALDSAKITPFHTKFAKQSSSTKFKSTKKVDPRARFTKIVDLLKGCSTKLKLVELEKIIHHCHWLHTLRTVSFLFSFSSRLDRPRGKNHYASSSCAASGHRRPSSRWRPSPVRPRPPGPAPPPLRGEAVPTRPSRAPFPARGRSLAWPTSLSSVSVDEKPLAPSQPPRSPLRAPSASTDEKAAPRH